MPAILSTATATTSFALEHFENGNGQLISGRQIGIRGGHGLTNLEGRLLQGISTIVSNEELALLQKNKNFCERLAGDNPWYKIIDEKNLPESHIAGMEQRDGSAPITQQDLDAKFEDGGLPAQVFEKTDVLNGKLKKQ